MVKDDFKEYQFHDSMIHGFKIIYEEWERGIVFDIDYILSGPIGESSPYEFILTKGKLYFRDVLGISFNIADYSNGLYIYKIERCLITDQSLLKNGGIDKTYYEWKILFDNEAPIIIKATNMEFVEHSRQLQVKGSRQSLYTSERNALEL